MFRRRGTGRGFRAAFRRLFRRGHLAGAPEARQEPAPEDPARDALREAQRSESLGHPIEAADLYERLAYRAQQMDRSRQAARLFLRAAECRLQGEQPSLAFPGIQQAFRLLAEAQDWRGLQRLGRRTEAGLHQRGYTAEADAVQQLLQQLLNELPDTTHPQPPPVVLLEAGKRPGAHQQTAHLPTHCPQCGAILHPNEVEWLNAATAECAYCGSPVSVV